MIFTQRQFNIEGYRVRGTTLSREAKDMQNILEETGDPILSRKQRDKPLHVFRRPDRNGNRVIEKPIYTLSI